MKSYSVMLVLLFLGLVVSQTCNPIKSGLSSAEQKKLLDAHNEFRNYVASGQTKLPQAKNIKVLKWSEKLAAQAQEYANQCVFEHSNGPDYGENLWIFMGSRLSAFPFDPQAPVKAWYDEINDFKKGSIDFYQFDQGTGHFTQLIWADTTTVGCGVTEFNEDGWGKRLVVCQYKTPGNYLNSPIYQSGKPCTSCGCDSKFKALCSK